MALPIIAAVGLFAAGYYLRDALDEDAPQSGGYSLPYTPPFAGGQCVIYYSVYVSFFINNSDGGGVRWTSEVLAGEYLGKIESVRQTGQGGTLYITTNGQEGIWYNGFSFFSSDVKIVRLAPSRGEIDNCGDLPDPNSPTDPATSGIAGGGFSPSVSPVTIREGAPLALVPPFAALLAAALAAAKLAAAAGAIADAISAIADAISSIKDLLDKLKDYLDDEDKEEEEKKETLEYRFGRVYGDGFLRLYPNSNFDGTICEILDIETVNIPLGYGKYFGEYSPNFYEYRRLGHILFVSPSFGVMEKREIEFGRHSFIVPIGAIGFFYHFGLDEVIRASVKGIYTKEVTDD